MLPVHGTITQYGAPQVIQAHPVCATRVQALRYINLPSEKQYGFVAEDVDKVLPSLVSSVKKLAITDTAGDTIAPTIAYKTLNYDAFAAILAKGIQEQQQSIDSLRKQHGGINGAGTANYVAKFAGPDSLTNSLVYDNGTNVVVNGTNIFGDSPSALMVQLNSTQSRMSILDKSTGNFLTTFDNVSDGALMRMWDNTGTQRVNIDANPGNFSWINTSLVVGSSAASGEQVVSPFMTWLDNTKTRVDVLDKNTNNFLFTFNNTSDNGVLNIFNSTTDVVNVSLSANGASYFNGGNVGMGTTNPTAQLDAENTSIVGGGVAIGVKATSTGTGMTNYGLYAAAANASTTNYAAYFNGDVYATGSYLPSDATIKTNIDSTHFSCSALCKLKPCTYNYKTGYPTLNLPSGTHFGLIAQDVEAVYPDLVKTVVQPAVYDTGGHIIDSAVTFKTVNYTGLIPLLVKAYQDQEKKTDSLTKVLASLQSCINSLCNQQGGSHRSQNNNNDSVTNVQNITLSSATAAILYQNTPNPFSTGTKINYFLPEGTMGATMMFFDMYGNKLKEVDLKNTGMGTINITPENLKDGIYTYSLIVNGQIIDTKKMVLQR